MKEITVETGEIMFSNDADSVLRAFRLGSTVACIMYHMESGCGAMACIALPDSSVDREKSGREPGYFADTAVQQLIDGFSARGISVTRDGVRAYCAGGAGVTGRSSSFHIGAATVRALRDHLTRRNIYITEDVGGTADRTVTLEIGSGEVSLFEPALGTWNI